MIHCSVCNRLFAEDVTRCTTCGRHLIGAPLVRGAGDFNHSGDAITQAIHARHRRLGLRLSLAIAALVQTVGMFLLADMRVWWHFLVMAALAMGATALIHLTRVGHLWCVVGMNIASYIAAYFTGYLDLTHFIHLTLALWLLSFWYVYLGHHLRMNNELHS